MHPPRWGLVQDTNTTSACLRGAGLWGYQQCTDQEMMERVHSHPQLPTGGGCQDIYHSCPGAISPFRCHADSLPGEEEDSNRGLGHDRAIVKSFFGGHEEAQRVLPHPHHCEGEVSRPLFHLCVPATPKLIPSPPHASEDHHNHMLIPGKGFIWTQEFLNSPSTISLLVPLTQGTD